MQDCQQICKNYYDQNGLSSFDTSNSIQCRMNELDGITQNTGNPYLQCSRASPYGDQACASDPCMNYCNFTMAICTGGNLLYSNYSTCYSYCKTMPKGNWNDTNVNSLGCRVNAAIKAALTGDMTLCQAASYTGGGICGSYCDTYCNFATTVCTYSNALSFGYDLAKCMSACSAYPTNGNNNSTRGNSVQCRIYHLEKVAIDYTLQATECTKADTLGGFTCSVGGALTNVVYFVLLLAIVALI